MNTRYWKVSPDVGIAMDPESKKITIFAGSVALELNGETGQFAYQGSVIENNGGNRQEDVFLQKEAGVMGLLPSTMFTPVPQATPNIPVAALTDLLGDMATMLSLL